MQHVPKTPWSVLPTLELREVHLDVQKRALNELITTVNAICFNVTSPFVNERVINARKSYGLSQ